MVTPPRFTRAVFGFACVLIVGSFPVAASESLTLPHLLPVFKGTLVPSEADSTEYFFPRTIKAPDEAPNILLVLTDDVSFGAVSVFGGSVPKPHLERVAERGLIYNRFHTAGVCSPTRASLLTGRNHHRVGVGFVTDTPTPYPGYQAVLPHAAASVARILRDNGYSTAMFGKEHNIPGEHLSFAGPFNLWPTGRGFEYFYGFIGGDTDQFRPALYRGIERVDGADRGEDYLFDKDMVNQTIQWIHNQKAAAPDKPFFIYHATGTAHAPQQAPIDWIEKFQGEFDHGWDEERERVLARQKALGLVPEDTELASRPADVPAWDSLSVAEKEVYARFMEVYAAMLAYQDAQFGRLLDELERMEILDDTLIIFIEGDNGTAGDVGNYGSLNEIADMTGREHKRNYELTWLANNLEVIGGPEAYAALPAGWSHAMSTPFPWFKQIASHLGAVRNGMVISWPKGINAHGKIRPQYHHVIDVMPTILEVAKVAMPTVVDGVEQLPLDGESMVYSFVDEGAPSPRTTQYYEVAGNRAIYHKGWLANTTPRNTPWNLLTRAVDTDPSTHTWELYDLRSDFSQSRNVAAEHPEILAQMETVFDQEARRNNVYPIQSSGSRERMSKMHPEGRETVTETIFWGPDVRLNRDSAPPIFSRSFTVAAKIKVPTEGADGVLLAAGSQFGGWSFYLQDGRPTVAAARSPQSGGLSRVTTGTALPPGDHHLIFEVDHQEEGSEVRIVLNDQEIGSGHIEQRPSLLAGLGETLDSGRDTNVPVVSDYRQSEGVFSGHIDKITVRLR